MASGLLTLVKVIELVAVEWRVAGAVRDELVNRDAALLVSPNQPKRTTALERDLQLAVTRQCDRPAVSRLNQCAPGAPELADMPMELPRRDRHGLSHTGHAGQYGEGGRDQPESCGSRAAAHTMPVAEVARTVVFRPEEGYLHILMTAATAVDVRPNSGLVKRRGDATRPRIIAMLSHGARCVCHLGGLIQSFARLAWSRRDSKPLPQGFGPGAGR